MTAATLTLGTRPQLDPVMFSELTVNSDSYFPKLAFIK
jgi:hypothetical protein